MKTVTIKVGQNVDFKVPVTGEPPPKCVWTFNDKPIDDKDAKIRVSFSPNQFNALTNSTGT